MSIRVKVTGRYPHIDGKERFMGEYCTENRDMALIWFGADYGRHVDQLDPSTVVLTVRNVVHRKI